MTAKQFFQCCGGNASHMDEGKHFCLQCGHPLEYFNDTTHRRLRCPRCSWTYYRNPSPGVVVLVPRADNVLLGRRAAGIYGGGKWCLPGGFIEYDESFLRAAIREFREETGFLIEVESILSVATNFLSESIHTLVIVLLGNIVDGTQIPGDDVVELEWFPSAGPLPEMAFEADRHIIERYWKSDLTGVPVDPVHARPAADDGFKNSGNQGPETPKHH